MRGGFRLLSTIAVIVFMVGAVIAQPGPPGRPGMPPGGPGIPPGRPGGPGVPPPLAPPPGTLVPFIDTHAHLAAAGPQAFGPGRPPAGPQAVAAVALSYMDRWRIQQTLVLPPPVPGGQPVADYEALAGVASASAGRFGFLGGGATLNPMIQQARADDHVSPDLRTKLETTARVIVQAGGVGFGELAALHLSFFDRHPFEEIAPDHPAFLLLADLAAGYDVPLDLHMEAVPADMPIPDGFMKPPNPTRLRANIPGFERLLSHNPRTRIVWEHIGWDNTGQMTVTLLRRLLEAHPNLYLQIKVFPRQGVSQNRPIDDGGKIRPEWAGIIRAFPDRFVIGTDTFYGGPPPLVDQYLTGASTLLAQLPDDLARKIGIENAARLYKLK